MNNTALYGLTVLIWGSTWFAIEFQLGVVAPEVSLVYRYGAASLLLFAWSAFSTTPGNCGSPARRCKVTSLRYRR